MFSIGRQKSPQCGRLLPKGYDTKAKMLATSNNCPTATVAAASGSWTSAPAMRWGSGRRWAMNGS